MQTALLGGISAQGKKQLEAQARRGGRSPKMVQVRHVTVCVRAAGSASGAGRDLYLGVEDGTCT